MISSKNTIDKTFITVKSHSTSDIHTCACTHTHISMYIQSQDMSVIQLTVNHNLAVKNNLLNIQTCMVNLTST